MTLNAADLPATPPAPPAAHCMARAFGQRSLYNANRPEVHDILRRWRHIADSYDPPRLLIGETNVEDLEILAGFYGQGDDELHLAFNFPFINAGFDAGELRAVVETTESLLPP